MAARTWLAVALSCLVWFGYLKWFAPPPPLPPKAAAANIHKTPGLSANSPANTLSAAKSTIPIPATPGTIVTLKNEFVELSLDSATGDLYRASLSRYSETLAPNSPRVQVVNPVSNAGAFAFQFSDAGLSSALSAGTYAVKQSDSTLEFSKAAQGFEITKEYRLGPEYGAEVTVQLDVPARADGNWGYLLVPVGGRELVVDRNNPLQTWEVAYSQNQKTERAVPTSVAEESVHQGVSDWLAFGNRYFFGAVLNRSELNPDIIVGNVGGFSGGYFRFPLAKKGENQYVFKLKFFIGPKDLRFLESEPTLRSIVDHGMFSFFAKPILFLLNFFYGFVQNYGIAIILLTLVVRVLFYPLSLKSFRSMRSMQKLQPQLAALKEKYKEDKERFNKEQLALFKAHGVNPAGGCLPMLVQLPVFIALYAVLQSAIELFHAPFFGWVKDLSAKDPFYIYPVLMGVAMFLQQRMTPTPGMDPVQQKMMLIMPVIFTFMMFNLPSGLTMYIFLSTLLGILQQWAMNREKGREAQVPVIST